MNNRGIATGMIVGISAIVFLLIIALIVPGVFGAGTVTNRGNEPTNCELKNFNFDVTGDLRIEDGSWIGVEPVITDIENVGFRSLSFLEPFDYTVELFDGVTNNKISDFKGNSKLSSSEKSTSVPFVLPFSVNDCDGLVDADFKIKATLKETKDISKDESIFEETFAVRKGRVIE